LAQQNPAWRKTLLPLLKTAGNKTLSDVISDALGPWAADFGGFLNRIIKGRFDLHSWKTKRTGSHNFSWDFDFQTKDTQASAVYTAKVLLIFDPSKPLSQALRSSVFLKQKDSPSNQQQGTWPLGMITGSEEGAIDVFDQQIKPMLKKLQD
jgi:hypothetical protein